MQQHTTRYSFTGVFIVFLLGAAAYAGLVFYHPGKTVQADTSTASHISMDGTAVPRSVYSSYPALARYDAEQAGINPNLFARQIQQESGFNPLAVSHAGAIGIAQFMPETAKGLGVNPYDPVSSLQGAARYMARLVAFYHGSYAMALAAYNAGPGAVTYAINHGGAANWQAYLPLETQHYITIIMG